MNRERFREIIDCTMQNRAAGRGFSFSASDVDAIVDSCEPFTDDKLAWVVIAEREICEFERRTFCMARAVEAANALSAGQDAA